MGLRLRKYIELRESWAAENYSGPSANIPKLDGRCDCTARAKSDIYDCLVTVKSFPVVMHCWLTGKFTITSIFRTSSESLPTVNQLFCDPDLMENFVPSCWQRDKQMATVADAKMLMADGMLTVAAHAHINAICRCVTACRPTCRSVMNNQSIIDRMCDSRQQNRFSQLAWLRPMTHGPEIGAEISSAVIRRATSPCRFLNSVPPALDDSLDERLEVRVSHTARSVSTCGSAKPRRTRLVLCRRFEFPWLYRCCTWSRWVSAAAKAKVLGLYRENAATATPVPVWGGEIGRRSDVVHTRPVADQEASAAARRRSADA